MKKLVIFDMDGTVVDSAADIGTAIVHAATTVCALPAGALTLADTAPLMGKSLHDTFALLLPPDQHGRIEECVLAYRSYYLANIDRTTHPFPGMVALLAELREAGVRLAVATTKAQRTVERLTDALGLTAAFDHIQGTDGFPGKPDPAILNRILRGMEIAPADAIMVGDTDNDVLCAQRAGVEVCAVTWGAWSADALAALHPDYLVNDVAELRAVLGINPLTEV